MTSRPEIPGSGAARRTAKGTGVVSVGRLYADLIFTGLPREPSLGTEIYADGFAMQAGGGACITAAHLAALGRMSYLAAFVPAPPFGPALTEKIEAAGVSLDLAQHAAKGQSPQVTAALAADGDRAFVTNRSGPAAPLLDPEQLTALGISHMHIGELATLVEMPDLLHIARTAGLSVSLDCAWDEALTARDVADLISDVDVFLPNAAEAEHLAKIGVPSPFAPLTIVKAGETGAYALADGAQIWAKTTPLKPLDTTGAGDAFNVGFLHQWLSGAPLADALRAGNAAGARAVQMVGGFAPCAPAARAQQTNLA